MRVPSWLVAKRACAIKRAGAGAAVSERCGEGPSYKDTPRARGPSGWTQGDVIDERRRCPSGSLAGIILVPVDVIDTGKLFDLHPSELPGALHNPREGAVKPRRLLFDLLQHRLRKVEALLTLVCF